MIFTDSEQQLLTLFGTDSHPDTVHILLQALPDIYEPHERNVAAGLILKLQGITGADEFPPQNCALEGGATYA
jgi:hypothetical protein